MKFTKLIAGGVALLACTSLLAACGNSSSSEGKVKLEYFSQKPEMATTLQEIIDDYNDSQDKVEVSLTSVPDAETVLKTRMANDEAPDIINVYPVSADFSGWAADGRFLELGDDSGVDNLTDGVAENYAVDGKVYNLPLNTNLYGIYYNKDKFEELGLEVPTTMTEFQELINKVKTSGETPFALSLSDAWTLNGYHQLAWVLATGGYNEAEDTLVHSAIGAISADAASTNTVVDYFKLLYNNSQSGSTGAAYSDAVAAFASGKALMMPQGSWAAAVINQQEPDFEYGTFALPGAEQGSAMTIGGPDLALSISSDTKYPDEAKDFLEYISSAEVMQKYYDVDGSPTSVVGVDTEGKFPELEGLSQYAFTDQQSAWLHNQWTSQDTFWDIAVNQVKNPDATELASDLNAFFDTMK